MKGSAVRIRASASSVGDERHSVMLSTDARAPDASDLEAVIEASHRALDAFFKGDADPMKPLFSRRDDVSLANPFGPPRRGWSEVEEAMERAAANYRDGGVIGFEQVSKHVTPELGYTLETEHYEAKV